MTMMRLTPDRLDSLPPTVARPGYDRRQLRSGIVHLGLGGFHRAHQAWYIEQALHHRFGPWGITGVSLRGAGAHEALAPQQGLYTLLVRSPDHTQGRVIGAIIETLVAPHNPEAVLAHLTHPDTELVTLTVTEKGYCLHNQRLDPQHPDILSDLEGRTISAPGYLVAALARRRAQDMDPFVIASCDNLRANGPTLKQALIDHAALRDDRLAAWIEAHLLCPSSMVDRITPHATDADRAEVRALTGCNDLAPVVTESFSQWALENSLRDALPVLGETLGIVGVEHVSRVEPYENMKLRLLNGSHLALAFLGQLSGLETIADVAHDPDFAAFCQRYMNEVAVTVTGLAPAQIAAYQPTLLARYANQSVRHLNRQVAMDGSQKTQQRWMSVLADLIAARKPYPCLVLSFASWFRFLQGKNDHGASLTIQDPHRDELIELIRSAGKPRAVVDAMLDHSRLFPEVLRRHEPLRGHLTQALTQLIDKGTRASVRALLEGG